MGKYLALVFVILLAPGQEASAAGGNGCLAGGVARQITDAELDAIVASHDCPIMNETVEKSTGLTKYDIQVSREAASKTMAAVMAKLGISGMKGKTFDWYCSELDVGMTTEENSALPDKDRHFVVSGGRAVAVSINQNNDTAVAVARRQALREIARDAAFNFLEFAETVSRKSHNDLSDIQKTIARIIGAQKALEEARKKERDEIARMIAEKGLLNEAIVRRLGELRNTVRKAGEDLSAARAKLRGVLTPREELRLVLNGVLD